MGLFDKIKNKKDDYKNKITSDDVSLGFCSCGNISSNKYCEICSRFISNRKRVSLNEYNQIINDEIIASLSEKYSTNFNEISLKDYFNLNQTQENHIIYKLIKAIVYDENDDNIPELFEKILDETIKVENEKETIMKNIKSEIVEKFYNGGYMYNILLTISKSGLTLVQDSVIQNKHGTGTKILATALAGPLGFVATSGIKQTTETKKVYVDGEYAHTQYVFNPESITIKSYSDTRNFNSFEPKNNDDIEKIIIKWEDIDYIDDEYSLILKSSDVIQLMPPNINDIANEHILNVVGTYDWNLNKQYHEEYITDIINQTISLFINLLNQFIEKTKSSTTTNSSDGSVKDLEKIVQMYEKGLLTDEEFISMKSKLINN